MLALASVMALQPSLLIMDEPTSQRPIAAADFLATVGKINRELGVTVILTEHRLEEAFPLASRAVVMDKGKILCEGAPADVGKALRERGHGMFQAMPVPMRIWAGIGNSLPCPVTVRDGREWLSQMEVKGELPEEPPEPERMHPAVELEEVWFRYEKDAGCDRAYPSSLSWSADCDSRRQRNGENHGALLIAGLNTPIVVK